MILVTGATGRLGGAVVDRLLERMPATELAVSVRDPDKARPLADRGVSVRRGDFTEPSTLAQAFEGASRVLITPGPPTRHRTPVPSPLPSPPVPSTSSTPPTWLPARNRCSPRPWVTPGPSRTCRSRASRHLAARRVPRHQRDVHAEPGSADRRAPPARRRPDRVDRAGGPRSGMLAPTGMDLSSLPRMSPADVVNAALTGIHLGETVIAPAWRTEPSPRESLPRRRSLTGHRGQPHLGGVKVVERPEVNAHVPSRPEGDRHNINNRQQRVRRLPNRTPPGKRPVGPRGVSQPTQLDVPRATCRNPTTDRFRSRPWPAVTSFTEVDPSTITAGGVAPTQGER